MWDVRGHLRYYYRYKVTDGKVRRVYIGTGEKAELEYAEDVRKKLEKQARKDAFLAEQAALKAAEAPVLEFFNMVDLVTKANLAAEGFRQHDSGTWRQWKLAKQQKRQESDIEGIHA